MHYEVIWQPLAEQKLAAIWTDAADRQAVTDAANSIDKRLASDAHTAGTLHYGTMRIVVEPPLSVHVDVHQQDQKVYVLTVRFLPLN